ncbi:hypothetical protein ALC57_08273, partial [Trachymyrmex cornetzi]
QVQTQKIVVQKMQEPTVSTVQSAQTKQSPVGRRYHQYQFKKAKTDLQLVLVASQEEQDKVEKSPTEDVKKLDETKAATQTQCMVFADRKQRCHANPRIADESDFYTSVISTTSSFLELPIVITNPNNSYKSVTEETQIQIPGN